MERRFYTLCGERSITIITISHRPALQYFHDRILSLDGKKKYHIEDVKKSEQVEVRQAAVTGSGDQTSKPAAHGRSRSTATQVREVLCLMQIALPSGFGVKMARSFFVAVGKTAVWNLYSVIMSKMYSRLLVRDTTGFRRYAVGLCIWANAAAFADCFNRHNQTHLGTDFRMKLSKNKSELK